MGNSMSRFVALGKTFRFEAAHHLPDYVGKCANVHGHSYKLEVRIEALRSAADAAGIVVDFDVLKKAVAGTVLDKYDHSDLNAFWKHPTAENMVSHMYAELQEWFDSHMAFKVTVRFVRLWETETCYAEAFAGE